jgi:hypothetical protein
MGLAARRGRTVAPNAGFAGQTSGQVDPLLIGQHASIGNECVEAG